jgi:arginine utilization regulatory protein
VRRLGSLRESEIDVKIISSVNREPHVAIAENALRPDLFYRLGVVFIRIPPLRERKEDIVLLARHFLAKHSRALNRNVSDISDDVLALFSRYQWPGNVRELEHVIEGAINLVVSSPTIERRHLQSHHTVWQRFSGQPDGRASDKPLPVGRTREPSSATGHDGHWSLAGPAAGLIQRKADLEKETIAEALASSRGNVSRAAREIGISRQLLAYKMKKYRIERRHYCA